MNNIFERATRSKLRFRTSVGIINTEDLWDLPLTGNGVTLDQVAREANRQLKADEEESFVQPKTRTNTENALRMDVVKRVIEVKLADRDRAEKAAATRARKQQILDLLHSKENEALASKSEDELRKMLDEL